MIKKLSQRIFLVIMVSLSTIIIGIIILFALFNYTNTINTASFMLERFMNGGIRRNINEKPEDEILNSSINMEGLYYVTIENSKVISNTSLNDKVQEYALKVNNSNKEKGIIGKYIYKVRRTKENTKIIFMEDENTVLHIKIILVFSVIGSLVALIIIYIIAKKISKTIVEPVEETLVKQKQFISDASHELKTPLAVIEANADVLENEISNNKWMGYIQNEIESMNKLINELLLLAKMENIENIKSYKQLDLSKETEIIVSMFESMAYEKNIKINNNIQENIIINANKEDIEHVLSVLIDNAIKHTESEKEIIVELNKEKNDIILQVKNMGEAIPEEERENIFERFYRIDKSRNRKEKRYGLGLPIAKSIIQKYNGKIEVDYKNKFTIFKVTIPI